MDSVSIIFYHGLLGLLLADKKTIITNSRLNMFFYLQNHLNREFSKVSFLFFYILKYPA